MRVGRGVVRDRCQTPFSVKGKPCRKHANRSTGVWGLVTVALIERFRDRLPVTRATPVVSLGEGSTPLLAAPRLARAAGVRELWLKWEASNPTGSYKDRGMTLAVSKALEEGAEAVLCASTGNTAGSAAAYAARAGLPAVVLTPHGAVSGAKLAQTRMLGATVLDVRGDFDEALAAAQELAARGTHVLVNSLNPYRREGQKTAVLEILEELGGPPDAFVLPYGGGGNTSSYAQALRELGLETPIVSVEAARRRETLATAIRIGDPVHADAVRAAGALVVSVDDDELVDAWRALAEQEGLFCEPSSAAGLAAVLRGDVAGERLALTITGHGLKDTAIADRLAAPPVAVAPDPDAIASASRSRTD
jgi:threonine synthase